MASNNGVAAIRPFSSISRIAVSRNSSGSAENPAPTKKSPDTSDDPYRNHERGSTILKNMAQFALAIYEILKDTMGNIIPITALVP